MGLLVGGTTATSATLVFETSIFIFAIWVVSYLCRVCLAVVGIGFGLYKAA